MVENEPDNQISYDSMYKSKLHFGQSIRTRNRIGRVSLKRTFPFCRFDTEAISSFDGMLRWAMHNLSNSAFKAFSARLEQRDGIWHFDNQPTYMGYYYAVLLEKTKIQLVPADEFSRMFAYTD